MEEPHDPTVLDAGSTPAEDAILFFFMINKMLIYLIRNDYGSICGVYNDLTLAYKAFKKVFEDMATNKDYDFLREEYGEGWDSELDHVPAVEIWNVNGKYEDEYYSLVDITSDIIKNMDEELND